MFPVLGALPLLGLSICNTMSIFDSYLWYLPKTVLSIDIACPKAPILVMELNTWVRLRTDNLKSGYTLLYSTAYLNTPKGT